MSTSSSIVGKIETSIQDKNQQLDFFLERIIVIDGKKIELDSAIKKLDTSILVDTNNVNQKLKDVQTAYQGRINAGCRSNLFWRIVSKRFTFEVNPDATGFSNAFISETVYTLKCTKISPNGYTPVAIHGKTSYSEYDIYRHTYYGIPLPELDDPNEMRYVTPSGQANTTTNAFPPLGIKYDNLYGLKYYDEPYARDLVDSFVGTFVGTIGAGTTEITVLESRETGITSKLKVGQNIISNKDLIFGDGVGIISAIGSTVGNLDYTVKKRQATAICSISTTGIGSITSIVIVDGGLGYGSSNPPSVTIAPPSGNVAVATATISQIYRNIGGIGIVNAGSGYTVAPTVTIAAPYVSAANGIGLTGTAGIVTFVSMVNVGFGYSPTEVPTVKFSDPPAIGVGIGTTATGTAVVSSGIITAVNITNPGYGYTTNPSVSFSTPGFTTATAYASISTAGIVTSITITNPGYAYSQKYPPTIYFSSPSVTSAGATVSVSAAGTISSINITNPGIGYSASPSITISPPFNDVLTLISLQDPVAVGASAPEPDGSLVLFTVLISAKQLEKSASDLAITFGTNPYSPQGIGIMNNNQVGIGVSVVYDNSGNANKVENWRPESKRDALVYNGEVLAEAINEPIVGAGKIFYNEGFTYKPRKKSGNSWVDANEGDVVTVVTASSILNTQLESLEDYVTSLSSCPTQETALTNAINIASSAKTSIASGLDDINLKINASNFFRRERNSYNSDIWSQRQLLGNLLSEIQKNNESLNCLNNQKILDIIQ